VWKSSSRLSSTHSAALNLLVPAFPNYAAGSGGPTSWHELLEIRGKIAERAIAHGE